MNTSWQWVFLGPGPEDPAPLCDIHPEGVSFHMTSANGATMSLDWLGGCRVSSMIKPFTRYVGKGIYLFGTSNSTYNVTLDGITTSFDSSLDGVIFAQDGLSRRTRRIIVTILPDNPDQVFSFDYALLTDVTPNG